MVSQWSASPVIDVWSLKTISVSYLFCHLCRCLLATMNVWVKQFLFWKWFFYFCLISLIVTETILLKFLIFEWKKWQSLLQYLTTERSVLNCSVEFFASWKQQSVSLEVKQKLLSEVSNKVQKKIGNCGKMQNTLLYNFKISLNDWSGLCCELTWISKKMDVYRKKRRNWNCCLTVDKKSKKLELRFYWCNFTWENKSLCWCYQWHRFYMF